MGSCSVVGPQWSIKVLFLVLNNHIKEVFISLGKKVKFSSRLYTVCGWDSLSIHHAHYLSSCCILRTHILTFLAPRRTPNLQFCWSLRFVLPRFVSSWMDSLSHLNCLHPNLSGNAMGCSLHTLPQFSAQLPGCCFPAIEIFLTLLCLSFKLINILKRFSDCCWNQS